MTTYEPVGVDEESNFPPRVQAKLSGTFAARLPGEVITYKLENLRRFRAVEADAINSQKILRCIGDSHFQGNDASNGLDMSNDGLYVRSGLIGQVRRLAATRYGEVGEGFLSLRNGDRWTKGSGVQEIGLGPTGMMWRLATGQTATLHCRKGEDVVLVEAWWQDDANLEPPTVTIDGGGSFTPPGADLDGITGVGTRRAYQFTLTGPSDKDYDVVFTGPAAPVIWDLCGASVVSQADQGWRVDRLAQGGGRMDSYFALNDPPFTTDRLNMNVGARARVVSGAFVTTTPGVDIVICDLHTNHVTPEGQTAGFTPALHKQYHQALATHVTDVIGSTYLITTGPPWVSVGPIPEAAFIDAVKEIADVNPNVAVFDIQADPMFATRDTAIANGLVKSGGDGHMTRAGHTRYAALLMQALTGRP